MAQERGASEGRISVIGRARAALQPDFASVEIGVESRGQTPAAALDGASQAVQAVIALATAFGIAPEDVETAAVTLQPANRTVRQPDGSVAERLDGYRSANTVRIRLGDMNRLGDLMRKALDAGANRIEGVGFGLRDPEGAESAVRLAAVKDASQQAARLAEAAGVRLGRVVSIEVPPQGANPAMARNAAPLRASRRTAVPLMAGTIEATAEVSATFAIAP
jgi:hypothetical protein